MPSTRIVPVRLGNRLFRAIRVADLTPTDSPLPTAQSIGLLERELLRPRDLPSLQRLLRTTGNLRHAFLSGHWTLLPPLAEIPNAPIPKPEPVSEQLKAAKTVKTWIEMEVVDEFGRPQPNQPYLCMLPDGRIETGTLDGRGRVRFDGIDPGNCVFTLTDLDQETWAKAA